MKNKELIHLRVDHDLTQAQMATIGGVSLSTYHYIENGNRRGSKAFWHKIQAHFGLGGEQMWKLQNPEI